MLSIQERGQLHLIDRSLFMRDSPIVALIDADSLIYMSMVKNTTYEDAILKLDTDMCNLLNKLKVNKYIAFTTPRMHFRRGIAKTKPYKGNRSGRLTPPMFYAVEAYAKQEWGFNPILGIEADDAVGIYQTRLRNEGVDTIICSPDKDVVKQTPGRHWNYFKKEWVNTTSEEAWQFLWEQAATGDSVDQIPGIHGVGAKTMEKAFLKVRKEDYPIRVLQMYIEKRGEKESIKNAIDRFKETFDLVYMLNDESEANKLGIQIPDTKVLDIQDIYNEQ